LGSYDLANVTSTLHSATTKSVSASNFQTPSTYETVGTYSRVARATVKVNRR
jgi:hypothetical protein